LVTPAEHQNERDLRFDKKGKGGRGYQSVRRNALSSRTGKKGPVYKTSRGGKKGELRKTSRIKEQEWLGPLEKVV